MQEKTKTWLLSLAVRTGVALGIFLIVFIVCRIFPDVLKTIRPVWTKSMDIQKTGTLLKELLKEMLP